MKYLCVLILIFAAGCGGSGSSSAGSNACSVVGANTKIVSGEACKDFTQTPVVRVITQYEDGDIGTCTGTVISHNKILTAAHCVVNLSNINARATELVIASGDAGRATIYQGTAISIHPGFRYEPPHTMFNDMAIILISPTTAIPPQPILTSSDTSVGTEVFVYGYGNTATNQPKPQSMDELFASIEDLRGASMLLANITNNHYWATFTKGQGMVCHGDSGGPLIVNNPTPMLIGVTSQANNKWGTCDPGDTALWTRLQSTEVINWLRAVAPDANYR